MSSNNRISPLVSTQLPFFVRSDHETFVAFLEAYYEYMEQANNTLNLGKPIERTKSLTSYYDVDQTLDEFSQKFYDQFLRFIPKDATANKEIIIKNAKDFYRAKGTEKALSFLLRILYSKEATYYYPKKDILRASDGNWFIQKSLRVTGTRINNNAASTLAEFQNFIMTTITGNTTNSTASVERVDRFIEAGTTIDELIITNIEGAFENGEKVTATFLDTPNNTTATITANVFGGIINTLTIDNVGQNYKVGDLLSFTGGGGSGANAVVSTVTVGNISSLLVATGGAGFLANNNLLITGGGGSGANAYVSSVNADETYHPNTYNIYSNTLAIEAQTALSNATYTNLALADANTTLENALATFAYGPTGPINAITIRTAGTGYTSTPTVDAVANSKVKALGILGRMDILDGGSGYAINDIIEFSSTYGNGANAKVSNVDANGVITAVQFTANDGYLIGGFGYKQTALPTTNVATTTGDGNARINVSAILGDGETFTAATGNIGSISAITILSRGANYTNAPSISVSSVSGTNANVYSTVIAGIFTYPGRWLNDDSHLSSYNFLQNQDYYQNFSYVVKIRESLRNYKKALKEMGHPAGVKLFGEYTEQDESLQSNTVNTTFQSYRITFAPGTWSLDNTDNLITITRVSHGLSNANTVYLEFDSNTVANSEYVVNGADANTFNVSYVTANANASGNLIIGTVIS